MNTLILGGLAGVLGMSAIIVGGLYIYDKGGDARENRITAEIQESTSEVFQQQIALRDERIRNAEQQRNFYRQENRRLQVDLDQRELDITGEVRAAAQEIRNAIPQDLGECPALSSDFVRLYNTAAGFPSDGDTASASRDTPSGRANSLPEKMSTSSTHNGQ